MPDAQLQSLPVPRRRRVFVGLTEVAGYFTSLQRGFLQLGIDCMVVDQSGGPFRYRRIGLLARLEGLIRWAHEAQARPGAAGGLGKAVRVAAFAAKGATHLVLLAWVVLRFDVVILTGGTTFFRGAEFPLLRALRKRVIVVYTGTDHRPPFLNGKLTRTMAVDDLLAEGRRIRDLVARSERYADAIVALPSSAQYHRRPFVNFLAIGIPFEAPAEAARGRSFFEGRGTRILHCPTDPVAKGSAAIRAVVARLVESGLEIDYVELSDQPNEVILAALAECDFVVDELYSDTPLARLATEAAAVGKPTVTGGYYARHLDPGRRSFLPPATFVVPDEIEAAIRRFVEEPALRQAAGRRVEEFVRTEWSPRSVAERYQRLIEGAFGNDWLHDPATLDYVDGWGLGSDEWLASVSAVVARSGTDGLGLNPSSEHAIAARLAPDVEPGHAVHA
jgi:hypothetical protein